MMYFPPFFRFPYSYPMYPKRPAYISNKSITAMPKKLEPPPLEKNEKKEKCESPLFEVFGLKLYFDDLLILGLLFILYSEGVDDINLYIALILLLLS